MGEDTSAPPPYNEVPPAYSAVTGIFPISAVFPVDLEGIERDANQRDVVVADCEQVRNRKSKCMFMIIKICSYCIRFVLGCFVFAIILQFLKALIKFPI